MRQHRTIITDLLSKTPGESVLLSGWVHAKRDHGKMTFIDLRDRTGLVQCVARGIGPIRHEDVVEIVGTVKLRPENMVNPDLETGKLEISVESCKVLNQCAEFLPIPTTDEAEQTGDDMRAQFRYIDLRRKKYQDILRMRSRFVNELRQMLNRADFVEIETPCLTQATSEGARDFIVPSRFYPGHCYALPQSPQQYKQLLMTGGFERYYQVARCFRDEATRHDRSFEFTQLDLEMSFEDQESIMDQTMKAVAAAATAVGAKLKDTIPVFTYAEAMEKFGADKFDLRTEEEKANNVLAFAWVTKFPFFKKDGANWSFTHNPFSAPIEEHREWHLKGENIDQIIAAQYDLVCNGHEVGGGSLRAYTREMLTATYKIMGYSKQEIEQSVGHMLTAFDYGTPPHGGLALGIDRLIMLIAGVESLRDVVAFPMTSSGRTSVMTAPTPITQAQYEELKLKQIGG